MRSLPAQRDYRPASASGTGHGSYMPQGTQMLPRPQHIDSLTLSVPFGH
jgi:hypothetical protein